MSRIDTLLRQSNIDIRHIEKYADEDFQDRLRDYTITVIKDVVNIIINCEIPFAEEGARDEILNNIEQKYVLELEE